MLRLGEDEDDDEIEDDFDAKPDQPETKGGTAEGDQGDEGKGGAAGEGETGGVGVRKNFRKPRRGLRTRRRVNSFRVRKRRIERERERLRGDGQ